MTTLTLYKGVAFDGVNSFPHITSKTAFDTYLAGKQQYSQDIHFNRIGEPILINEGYDTAIGYGYGCIDTGSKKYFIIPDSISVNENNRVYLSYSVDWYTTLKYDSKISFGRSHLIKSTDVNPLTYPQGIQPSDMRVKTNEEIKLEPVGASEGNYNQEIIIIYTEPDNEGTVKWAVSLMRNNGAYYSSSNTRSLTPENIYNGDFLKVLGMLLDEDLPPDNILGVFFSPIAVHYTQGPMSPFISLTHEYEDGKYQGAYAADYTRVKGDGEVNLTAPITTTTTKVGVITDTTGNIIYTVPYGRTVSSIKFTMLASLTQCYIRMEFNDSIPHQAQNAENSSILYACEKIDYISDAYKNWAAGLKGVEVEERRIQKNKNLVSGVGNATIAGSIGGATGNPLTAAAAAAASLASSALSYGVETYYESDINRLEDRKYQLAQDTTIPGSFIGPGFFHAIQLEAPASDITRYYTELSYFGADCNLPLSSWTPSVGAYKFADVEIKADVPYSIKQNIRQKMMSGIKIVGV